MAILYNCITFITTYARYENRAIKQSWVVSTQIWVRYGQTQMLGWKMQLKHLQLKVTV